jgi:hypothetical protein
VASWLKVWPLLKIYPEKTELLKKTGYFLKYPPLDLDA